MRETQKGLKEYIAAAPLSTQKGKMGIADVPL